MKKTNNGIVDYELLTKSISPLSNLKSNSHKKSDTRIRKRKTTLTTTTTMVMMKRTDKGIDVRMVPIGQPDDDDDDDKD